MRMKTPLLTLMAAASWEVEYVVLQHVAVLVDRAPGVFDAEFKQFFLKHNEPTSVRHIKLDIMPQLANDGNVGEIVAELSEYVKHNTTSAVATAHFVSYTLPPSLPPGMCRM